MTFNIKLLVAYAGTNYFGWQKNGESASIEGTLGTALSKVLQHDVYLQAASRTDAGVHADGQVVNFLTHRPLRFSKFRLHVNSLLPADLVVLQAEEASPDFHPSLHVKGKEYHYHLCCHAVQRPKNRQFIWHYPRNVHLASMREAARLLAGTHDFAAFCNHKPGLVYSSTMRSVSKIEIEERAEGCFCFIVEGDHFLYKMVRTLVGTIVYAGMGKLQPSDIPRIIRSKDRTQAGITAPAHGLTLFKVNYS